MGSEGQKVPQTDGAPSRVVIEGVAPEIDGGRFPIKRTVGEEVVVSADIFAEGHDLLTAVVKYRSPGDLEWSESPMAPLVNDRWTGRFTVDVLGRYEYSFEAWVDRFRSWLKELSKKNEAGQDVSSELLEGAEHVREAAGAPEVRTPIGSASNRESCAIRPIRPPASGSHWTRSLRRPWRVIPIGGAASPTIARSS